MKTIKVNNIFGLSKITANTPCGIDKELLTINVSNYIYTKQLGACGLKLICSDVVYELKFKSIEFMESFVANFDMFMNDSVKSDYLGTFMKSYTYKDMDAYVHISENSIKCETNVGDYWVKFNTGGIFGLYDEKHQIEEFLINPDWKEVYQFQKNHELKYKGK